MLAFPRAAVILIITASIFAALPSASAKCYDAMILDDPTGLVGLGLGTGGAIGFLVSSDPTGTGGSGVFFQVRPADCTGVGLGAGNNSTSDPTSVADPYESWLPLP